MGKKKPEVLVFLSVSAAMLWILPLYLPTTWTLRSQELDPIKKCWGLNWLGAMDPSVVTTTQ